MLNRAHVFVLLGITFSSYVTALGNGFVWDDRTLLMDNPYIQDVRLLLDGLLSDFWRVMDDPSRFRNYYRPLTTLTYFTDYAVWGENPFGFHLTNVLLHLTTVLLVYIVGRRIGLGPEGAFASASLFAVHPIHTESVAWISGRTDVLAAALTLAAFALVRIENARWPKLFLAAGTLLYFLALLAKEVAILLPATVAVHGLWLGRRDERARRRFTATLACLVGASVAYLILRIVLLDMRLWLPRPSSAPVLAFNLPVIVGWYLLKLVWPLPLSAHVPLKLLPFERWPVVLAAVGALVGAAILVRLAGRRNPLGNFSAAWTLLFLLPVLNAGSFTDVLVAERFLYLPSVGFCWLVGTLYELLPRRAFSGISAKRAFVAATLFAAGVVTLKRNLIWRDEIGFFREMVLTSGDYALPHNALGMAYLRSGDPQSAIPEFQEALRLGSEECLAVNALALSYLRLGVLIRSGATLDTGFALVEQAVSGVCRNADILHNTLGEYYMRQKKPDKALDAFRKALGLNPLRMGYYHNVGTILFMSGRKEEARPYLEQYVARAPDGPLKDQAIQFLRQ